MTPAISAHCRASDQARILCLGDDVEQLEIQYQLDSDIDFVIVAGPDEGYAALATEAPFDIIISDQQMRSGRGQLFLTRLRKHSPDAERVMLARRAEPGRDGSGGRETAPSCGRRFRPSRAHRAETPQHGQAGHVVLVLASSATAMASDTPSRRAIRS